MNNRVQQKPFGIDDHVALAPPCSLARIVAPRIDQAHHFSADLAV